MINYIYNDNIIIYAFASLCGLGIVVRFILDMAYIYLVKESDRLGTTNNKTLKHMRMKFETCYKLNIGVNNVDTFVDKNLTKYRFCGILLSTWENFSGQVLLLSFLIVPISAIFGVIFEINREQILYTGAVGILAGAVLILVDKMANIPVKKNMIRLNLLDYLENFCKVRLEQEVYHPEKLEQYRKEYLVAAATKVKKIKVEPEEKQVVNRRAEARKRKDEEKKLKALKREEEQKRIEEAKYEAERQKLEERKLLAVKRREDELKKLQEGKEILMLRKEGLKKKDEEKQEEKEVKGRIIKSIEEELLTAKKAEEDQRLESVEEIAAHMEKEEKEAKKDSDKFVLPEMSPEEEKLVDDILREFFA